MDSNHHQDATSADGSANTAPAEVGQPGHPPIRLRTDNMVRPLPVPPPAALPPMPLPAAIRGRPPGLTTRLDLMRRAVLYVPHPSVPVLKIGTTNRKPGSQCCSRRPSRCCRHRRHAYLKGVCWDKPCLRLESQYEHLILFLLPCCCHGCFLFTSSQLGPARGCMGRVYCD